MSIEAAYKYTCTSGCGATAFALAEQLPDGWSLSSDLGHHCPACTAKPKPKPAEPFVPPFIQIGTGNEMRDSDESHVGYNNNAHVVVHRLNATIAEAKRQAVAEWVAGLPPCPHVFLGSSGESCCETSQWVSRCIQLVASAQRGETLPPMPECVARLCASFTAAIGGYPDTRVADVRAHYAPLFNEESAK